MSTLVKKTLANVLKMGSFDGAWYAEHNCSNCVAKRQISKEYVKNM